jgi:hypothetical protein
LALTADHGLGQNGSEIRQNFERRPFVVRHELCEHPLLQLPRIIELSQTLPNQAAEYNVATLPLNQDYLRTPKSGLSVAETLQEIDNCNSWMVLKNVETDPAYRTLLIECVNALRPYAEPMAPGICKPEAFIFVSSPYAVTPYHCDPEHNFLLQIRGHKCVAVADRDDSEAVTQVQLEAKANGAHRNLPFEEKLRARQKIFDLQPGYGLHVPVHCPHWVRVADQVSVSLSITFRSRASERRLAVLRFNSRLRRLGFEPTRPGRDFVRDQLKHFSERVIGRIAGRRNAPKY